MIENIRERKPGRPKGVMAPTSDAVLKVRQALNLTQPEMARELGCSFSGVQRLERLSRLPNSAAVRASLMRLAKKAGVEVSERRTVAANTTNGTSNGAAKQ